MKLTFVEASGFTAAIPGYFESDEAYRLFQESLLLNPDRGAVMKGCAGLRKVRWRNPRRSMGQRGGLRIIYLHIPEAAWIILLDIYDKNEADDLTSAERRELADLAHSLRQEILSSQVKAKRTASANGSQL